MPPLTKLRGLLLLPLALLAGCNMVVLNPSGDIARQQGQLIVISTVLMLLIIVPVIGLTIFFAWKYRQSNKEAKYQPEWDHSTELELAICRAIFDDHPGLSPIQARTEAPLRPLTSSDRVAGVRPGA